jgi:hypothetical protein
MTGAGMLAALIAVEVRWSNVYTEPRLILGGIVIVGVLICVAWAKLRRDD